MGRDAWVTLGLERLAGVGPRALQLESICAAAGRTRGSFYHHFRDHAEFLDAIAERWRRGQTEALSELERQEAATDGPRGIRRLATRIDPAVELGMRRLGAGDDRIRAVVAEVDRRRIDHLTRFHASRPGVSRNQAAGFAWLEYSAYVGSQVLWPDANAEELAKTGDLLSDCLAVIAGSGPAASSG